MSAHADGSDAGHGNVWYHGKAIPAAEYQKLKKGGDKAKEDGAHHEAH